MSGLGGDGIELSNVFIVSQCVTFILIFTEIRIAGNKVSCFVLFTETHSQFCRFILQPRSHCSALHWWGSRQTGRSRLQVRLPAEVGQQQAAGGAEGSGGVGSAAAARLPAGLRAGSGLIIKFLLPIIYYIQNFVVRPRLAHWKISDMETC